MSLRCLPDVPDGCRQMHPICLPSIHLSVYLSSHIPLYSSMHPSIYPSARLSIDPFIHLSAYPSTHLSIHPSLQFSTYPSSIYLSIYPSIHLHHLYTSTHPSICPSECQEKSCLASRAGIIVHVFWFISYSYFLYFIRYTPTPIAFRQACSSQWEFSLALYSFQGVMGLGGGSGMFVAWPTRT